jgi:hypothetical protein
MTAPNARRALLRMLLLPRPGLGDGTIPEIVVQATISPNPSRLAAFRALVGDRSPGLPLTWPYVLATPLHMEIVGDRRFPLPGFGLVHQRERIERFAPIPEDAPLALACRVAGHEPHETGVSFDLTTTAHVGRELVWRSTTTAFKRYPDAPRRHDRWEGAPPVGETWEVPANMGRQYARVSRNFDPIHLSGFTARPFGFPRAVVHGMWTVARSVAALSLPGGPAFLEVSFRRPLLLPATVVFVADRGETSRFAVAPTEGGKPYIEGRAAAR